MSKFKRIIVTPTTEAIIDTEDISYVLENEDSCTVTIHFISGAEPLISQMDFNDLISALFGEDYPEHR